jgi:hypothetical protein
MTLKTAQLAIINQLFTRQAGARRTPSPSSQADLLGRMPPAGVARQAWRLLRQQGLIDARGRLTLSGLAVAVALRAHLRRSAREVIVEGKPASLVQTSQRDRVVPLAA